MDKLSSFKKKLVKRFELLEALTWFALLALSGLWLQEHWQFLWAVTLANRISKSGHTCIGNIVFSDIAGF